MEYSEIFKKKSFSVVISEEINEKLKENLLRDDFQEDLIFALWTPSIGNKRFSAIVNEIVFPLENDKNVHGNASYNYSYLIRVCKLAMSKGKGVVLLHSHLGPGWQGMSSDDISTEKKTFINSETTTGLPFVGLTIGTDGYWSARIWYYSKNLLIKRKLAESVRVCGTKLKSYFNNNIVPIQEPNGKQIRTVNIWGDEAHKEISRLNIGIVGLGSVGSAVAEILARMGMTKFTLIDFDIVKEHNLDRLTGVYKKDIGKKKVRVIRSSIKKSATADKITIDICEESIANEKGYKSVLDCDVIVCCADKPRPRYISNHIAYAHLIPVIDGGMLIEFNDDRELNFGDWTVHTVRPGYPCLQCLDAYYTSDVELEKSGKLKDKDYIQGLPKNHHLLSSDNVAPFTMNLASFEVLHFVALTTEIVDSEFYCEQRYRFKHGHLSKIKTDCKPGCDFQSNIGIGDTYFEVFDK